MGNANQNVLFCVKHTSDFDVLVPKNDVKYLINSFIVIIFSKNSFGYWLNNTYVIKMGFTCSF